MRTVERSRFLAVTPDELARHLSPTAVVEHEGTFTVTDVEPTDEGTRLLARGGGLTAVFQFQERDDGLHYRQVGAEGPFERMETTVTYAAEDHGSEVTVRSTVGLGLPLAVVTDRVAAWKRRGELDRLLEGLAEAAGDGSTS